jgi:hypothetical protein
MEELDARAFRGHRRSLEGGRNPACDERALSTEAVARLGISEWLLLAAIIREGRGQGARRPRGDNDA